MNNENNLELPIFTEEQRAQMDSVWNTLLEAGGSVPVAVERLKLEKGIQTTDASLPLLLLDDKNNLDRLMKLYRLTIIMDLYNTITAARLQLSQNMDKMSVDEVGTLYQNLTGRFLEFLEGRHKGSSGAGVNANMQQVNIHVQTALDALPANIRESVLELSETQFKDLASDSNIGDDDDDI